MAAEKEPLPEEAQVVAKGNALMGAALFRTLAEKNPKQNLILSPFSLSVVMAMLQLGAKGKTSVEIQTVFKFPFKTEGLIKGYSHVMQALQQIGGGCILLTANRIYLNTGFMVNKGFYSSVKSVFGVEPHQLDFSKRTAAVAEINHWVEKVTRDKIKNLMSQHSLGSAVKIVLVSGIYFKGKWKTKFEEKDTEKKGTFHLDSQNTVECPIMKISNRYAYATFEEMHAHALILPYEGDNLAMIVYAPKDFNGLALIEEHMGKLIPQEVRGSFKSKSDVHVLLPRFKVETGGSLVKPLQKMGLQSIFKPGARLSGIPEYEMELIVSEIMQKAMIEVNEEGSEAAAATGMVAYSRMMPHPIDFKADRPFYFQIVDLRTNFILFSGCVRDPTATK